MTIAALHLGGRHDFLVSTPYYNVSLGPMLLTTKTCLGSLYASMSSLNTQPTVGWQQHARVVCFLSKPGTRPSTTRPWRASFSSQSLGLEAKKQRLHCLATALCVPLRKQQTYVDQDTLSDNLFVEIIKSIFRDLQNGVLFILKQPKELQYLEFPSLQSAGKMAIFTIAVVMVLIVFLATVDSGLSFIVASVFRCIR